MKKKVRKVKEKAEEPKSFMQRFRASRLTLIILVVIGIVAIAVYMVLFYTSMCNNFSCFQDSMNRCSRSIYINEEPEATWGYRIVGRDGASCVVEVELLYAKKGSLDVDKLQGFTMDCSYPVGVAAYPEKDLSKCHGRLKEELQKIIIEKLHTYVLENLEEVKAGLFQAV